MIKILVAVVGIVLIAYGAREYVRVSALIKKGTALGNTAQPFVRSGDQFSRTLLVVGDSTAVGQGARAEDSVAGRLASDLNASVENYAESGAVAADVDGQIAKAKRTKFDLILIQIGANDVIRLRPLTETAEQVDAVLERARALSERVVLLTSGDIGSAPFFPAPYSWLLSLRTRELRSLLIEKTSKRGVIYVDLYARTSPFAEDPERYYAADYLHLSGDGYGYWYSVVREYVKNTWPELK